MYPFGDKASSHPPLLSVKSGEAADFGLPPDLADQDHEQRLRDLNLEPSSAANTDNNSNNNDNKNDNSYEHDARDNEGRPYFAGDEHLEFMEDRPSAGGLGGSRRLHSARIRHSIRTSKDMRRLKGRSTRSSTLETVGSYICGSLGNHVKRREAHRKICWAFLHGEPSTQPWSGRYALFTASLIVANVIADILDSITDFPFSEDRSTSFRCMEIFTCAVFTIEYCCRFWSCVEGEVEESPNPKSNCQKRFMWMQKAMPLLDLVVLVVFYCDIFMTSDRTRGLQAIRVLRLLALLKMERQTSSFATILAVLSKKRHELSATVFLALVLLVVASTSMYYIENPTQPTKFSSIPATMWWACAAMTTVGYGDIYPESPGGKILGAVVAFLGIGLFALPSGIVSSGFMEVLEDERRVDNDEIADMIDEDKQAVQALRDDVGALREAVEAIRLLAESNSERIRQLQEGDFGRDRASTTSSLTLAAVDAPSSLGTQRAQATSLAPTLSATSEGFEKERAWSGSGSGAELLQPTTGISGALGSPRPASSSFGGSGEADLPLERDVDLGLEK